MARGVVIPFTLNPREFLSGIKRITTGLDDVQDELKRVERSGDKLEDAFDGIGAKAEREFDRVERASRDVDFDRGGTLRGKAGTIGAETGSEFVESWGEAVRAGNPGEAIGETVTNAGLIATAAGPIGAAVGLGVALIGGVVMGMRQEAQRVRQALIDTITGAGDTALEEQGYTSGREFVAGLDRALSEASAGRAALQDYYGTDTFLEALTKAQDEARNLGVPMQTILDLVGGTTVQTEATIAALRAQADVLQTQITTAYEDANGTLDNMTLEQQQQVVEWTRQRDGIRDLIGEGKIRLDQVDREADAVNQVYLEQVKVTEAARDAAAAARGGADAAAAAASSWAATAANARAARDALAQARYEADRIPPSVTINVLNKLERLPI